MEVICDKAGECDSRKCYKKRPHDISYLGHCKPEGCDKDWECPYFGGTVHCIPVAKEKQAMSKDEQGKWRIRTAGGTWVVCTHSLALQKGIQYIHSDGTVHDTGILSEGGAYKTFLLAQTALDAYLGKQVICSNAKACSQSCRSKKPHKYTEQCDKGCSHDPEVSCIPIEAEVPNEEQEVLAEKPKIEIRCTTCGHGYSFYSKDPCKSCNGRSHWKPEGSVEPKQITKEPTERKTMFKKALQRIVVIWCAIGLVRLCIVVNPLVFALARMIHPNWKTGVPLDNGNISHIFGMWIAVAMGISILYLAGYGVHCFSNWLFGTKK